MELVLDAAFDELLVVLVLVGGVLALVASPPAVAGDVRTRAGDIFFEGEFEPVTASSEQGSISRP